MRQIIERLSDEDFARYRKTVARWEAAQCSPPDLTLDEAERRYAILLEILEEFQSKYEIDDSEDWKIDPATGVIAYGGE